MGATFTPLIEHSGLDLPRNMRKLANEFYMEKYGKSVEESGEYRKGTMVGRILGRQPLQY